MSERYEKRFALTGSLYGEGAPVLIAAGVLILVLGHRRWKSSR